MVAEDHVVGGMSTPLGGYGQVPGGLGQFHQFTHDGAQRLHLVAGEVEAGLGAGVAHQLLADRVPLALEGVEQAFRGAKR
ncbi:hypothetical protein [Streptomyces sp. DHE17-7]|uniref:hypothetical protein n=1 Tax=Streptomyces sp. DHE17-7 TaxID=2759949 RepID=UPI0022EAEC29|nr:hypothetical protein [Streptomyces sp. DHE17-7]MBJ6623435.1 hypothetical protein [Streptomyces sp. DHE17-7]